MTIERSPHPVFAALWVLWTANVIAALLLPHHPRYGLFVLLSFFVVEIPAALLKSGGMRDTLSEIATWAARKTDKARRFARGWNAALLALVLCVGWLVERTFYRYSEERLMAVVIAGLIVVWLYDHFTDPPTYG